MNCYSVYMENKQVRVFPYSVTEQGDRARAETLALSLYAKFRDAGYASSVEWFHMCGVGRTIVGGDA
jgi:hypothetical protein